VIMGCGHPGFRDDGQTTASPGTYQFVGGKATWDALKQGTLSVQDCDGDGKSDPWTLIDSRARFQDLIVTRNPPRRVLGLAPIRSTLQEFRPGDPAADPGAAPLIQSVPTLSEMSLGALNVLGGNPKGFFLMIEGGAIDWACHANRKGRMIEETLAFKDAIEAVTRWVQYNSNWNETLVIVVADHETGLLWGPTAGRFNPVVGRGVGHVPAMTFNSDYHTNQLVQFFAKGPRPVGLWLRQIPKKQDPRRGEYLDNTDLGRLLIGLVNGSLDPAAAPPAKAKSKI